MATVALIGAFDTKGTECAWIAQRIRDHGARVLTVDVGVFSDAETDVGPEAVAAAAGESLSELQRDADRGRTMEALARGAEAVIVSRARSGEVDAVFAAGGSGGSSIASRTMRALPVGFPKLLVSTMASGDTSVYVGETDTTMMYSVVDVAGVNSVSEQIFANAAAAVAAMAQDYERRRHDAAPHGRVVALSMFGLTTPAVDEARHELERLGYEPLVSHATGSGGRALEKLARDHQLSGVIDMTTTELADDLVGGVLSAGPHRLEEAARQGIPQVVSLGALDMVNFGPRDSVPPQFKDRRFVVHHPAVTLMRTTAEESAELGRRVATRLREAVGPAAVMVPLRGLSGLDKEGGPFWDPQADAALVQEIRDGLTDSAVRVTEHDLHLNDPGFGAEAARLLDSMIVRQQVAEA